MASSSSDLQPLRQRLSVVLRWCQTVVILLVVAGIVLRFVHESPLPLDLIGVTVLVASPFVLTAVVALTADRHPGRLIAFAVATLALASLGIALAA